MPISKHFDGHGEEVMASMKKTYGGAKAEQVFYATENKQKKESSVKAGMKAAMKKKGKK
jgi:hypothetical protein